jgi:hypothetical protein
LKAQTDWIFDSAGDLREPVSVEQERIGLTWDLQLALALLDATAGTGTGGMTDSDGEFWDSYALDLPSPLDVTVPFCMNMLDSSALRQNYQNEQVQKANEKSSYIDTYYILS